MPSPSSNYLRGANTAGSSDSPQIPDENSILIAVGKPRNVNVDMTTLAAELGTTPELVSRVIEELIRSGLLEPDIGNLKLSAMGMRALRYASVSKS
jgi:hypothetical protein